MGQTLVSAGRRCKGPQLVPGTPAPAPTRRPITGLPMEDC